MVLSFELVVLLEGSFDKLPASPEMTGLRRASRTSFWFSVSDLVGFLTRMDTDLETWTDTDWLADESD